MKYRKNLETAPNAEPDVAQGPESEPPAEHSELAGAGRGKVQELAYRYWEESDRFPRAADEHWFRAEREIRDGSKPVK